MKVTTTDKAEALRTGKVFIDKNFLKMDRLTKYVPHRCKYCMAILGDFHQGLFYCDEWCRELGIKQNTQHTKSRKCKYCDNQVFPILRVDGRKSGMFRTVCDDCTTKKIENANLRRREIKQRVASKGHTCKACGVYKKIDEFHKNATLAKGIHYTCKTCTSEYKKKKYLEKKYGKSI